MGRDFLDIQYYSGYNSKDPVRRGCDPTSALLSDIHPGTELNPYCSIEWFYNTLFSYMITDYIYYFSPYL